MLNNLLSNITITISTQMLKIPSYIIIFIIGLFIGTLLKFIADLITEGKKLSFKQSKCGNCEQKLKFRDAVPLFSYIFSKGKCKNCNEKIPIAYPISEILTAILLVATAYLTNILEVTSFPSNLLTFLYISFVTFFYITFFLISIKNEKVPNKFLKSLTIVVFFIIILKLVLIGYSLYVNGKAKQIGKYLTGWEDWARIILKILEKPATKIIASLGLALPFWLVQKIKKSGVENKNYFKLVFVIGLIQSFPSNLVTLGLALILTGIINVILTILKVRKKDKGIIFAPILVFSSYLVFLIGPGLLKTYLGMLY